MKKETFINQKKGKKMMKRILLSVLVVLFLGNIGFAQKLSPGQKNRLARIEYKVKLVGDALVGVRADGIETPKVMGNPVITTGPKKFQKVMPEWDATISYTWTQGNTIYDLQSNGSTLQLWQDPNTPANIHAVLMYAGADDPTYINRRVRYFFSSDTGSTWEYVGVAGDFKTGYGCITGTSDGNALIALHGALNPPSAVTRTLFFADAAPGLGSFSLLDPGTVTTPHSTNIGLIWPRVVATGSISEAIKFAFVNGQSGPVDSVTYTSYSNSLTSNNFGPLTLVGADQAETYSIARSVAGKIGLAYVGNDLGLNSGSIYFMESTDHGVTYSTPTLIFRPNYLGDSLGGLRGICMVYQGEVPKVVFQTTKMSTEGSFYPGAAGNIRFWSTSLPGSDPNRSIIVADTNNIGYHPYLGVNDVMSTFNRPVIGRSADGNALFIGFMTPSDYYNADTTSSFMDIYLTGSVDQGATWRNPQKINFETPRRDWEFLSISPVNDVDAGHFYANLVCLADSVPGSMVNGSPQSLAMQYFIRVQMPKWVGISQVGTEIPANYSLSQNYPNPFNPSTTIRFALPKTSNVTLKVYNMSGQEVSTLLSNSTVQAGTSEFKFDASKLSSGVYFYSLTAGNFRETKKMVLIK